MPSKALVIIVIVALAVLCGVLAGTSAGIGETEAEGSSGYVAGPWRCKAFVSDEGIERRAASWLYRYASTGPSTVVSLPPGSAGSRPVTTLCAWDPGFAADQWIQLERERREHEERVRARKRKLQKHKQKGSGELFPEDAPIEEEDSGDRR